MTASSWTSREPEAPEVVERVIDTTNWHWATFNSNGTEVVLTDKLGGGGVSPAALTSR